MARPFALILAMTVLAGCNGAQPAQNPFLGRTTVPPPGTILPGQQGAAAPYYQPPANSYQPPAANYRTPPAGASSATPGPGGAYIPPSGSSAPTGGYGENGIRRTRADSLGPNEYSVGRHTIARARPPKTGEGIAVRHAVHPDDGTIAASTTITRSRSKRELDRAFDDAESEDDSDAVATVSHTEPSPDGDGEHLATNVATVSHRAAIRIEERDPSTVIDDGDWVDVNEEDDPHEESETRAPGRFRPPSSAKRIAQRSPQVTRDDVVQAAVTQVESPATGSLDSADEPRDVAGVAPKSKSEPTVPSHLQASYGYDRAYKWIKGKLEYSDRKRQWKLRYIPIDGETDSYGGSVILSDSPQLEEFEPGDFIAVQGQIGESDGGSIGFAPSYTVRRVKRLVE